MNTNPKSSSGIFRLFRCLPQICNGNKRVIQFSSHLIPPKIVLNTYGPSKNIKPGSKYFRWCIKSIRPGLAAHPHITWPNFNKIHRKLQTNSINSNSNNTGHHMYTGAGIHQQFIRWACNPFKKRVTRMQGAHNRIPLLLDYFPINSISGNYCLLCMAVVYFVEEKWDTLLKTVSA